MNNELEMSPNKLVAALGKPSKEFTKADIIGYIKQNDIRMVNFMYPAGDGRLKTLNFVINNAAYLDAILTCGERVDGSSLSVLHFWTRLQRFQHCLCSVLILTRMVNLLKVLLKIPFARLAVPSMK